MKRALLLIVTACEPAPPAPLQCEQGATCGPGTTQSGGYCLPADPHLIQIRVAETEIGANGHTRRSIVAFGTQDVFGAPIEKRLVFGVDRASAGTIDFPFHTPDASGAAHALFTPCNATTPGCLGPATLTLALASDPSQLIAQTSINLVPDTGVSSVAPCIDHPRKLHLDSAVNHPPAIFEADEGAWDVVAQTPDRFAIDIHPVPAANSGSLISLNFDAAQLAAPLTPGIYEDARPSSAAIPDKPVFDSSEAPTCGTVTTRFQIHAYSSTEFLATFEQLCDGTSIAEGCVKYTP